MKTTLATIKSFIKKSNNLYIKNLSSFSGYTDCVEYLDSPTFQKAVSPADDRNHKNCLGIQGAWFVFGSRDYFREYDDGEFIGYEVYNCCGKFILATPKNVRINVENNGDSLAGTTVIANGVAYKYVI